MRPRRPKQGGLPTAADLNDQSIDGPSVERHYLGKSLRQAQEMIATNSLPYIFDFYHMPLRGFVYYLPALTGFILSPATNEDANSVSAFFSGIELRFDEIRAEAREVVPLLIATLQSIKDDWERFFWFHDPDTIPWKMIQQEEKYRAETWAELLSLIDRLEAIAPSRGRSKSSRPRRS